MNKLKLFLCESKNPIKDGYIWNMISSVLFAFQSVILIIALTRTVGLQDTGIFTIAYANASLFLLIGKYGVRNYQISDIKYEHTFYEYRNARTISTIFMVVTAISYVSYNYFYNDYSLRKTLIILLICLYKVPDAIEDVYFGEYQRRKRLDIGAKVMATRLFFSICVFIVSVSVTKNLLISALISVILSFGAMVLLIHWTSSILGYENSNVSIYSIKNIYRDCFPLFAGTFLSQYISNAPKYAIDSHLGDEVQAYYGFIAMPVFVVGLLNSVIFSPVIRKMAMLWDAGQIKDFVRRILIQVFIISIITLLCITGAYLLGIPVLSFLYHTDLSLYKNELIILLLGGGFLTLSSVLNVVITIMRKQKAVFWGYLIIALAAILLSDKMVILYGVNGAAWLYVFLMLGLSVSFGGILMFSLIQRIRKTNSACGM